MGALPTRRLLPGDCPALILLYFGAPFADSMAAICTSHAASRFHARVFSTRLLHTGFFRRKGFAAFNLVSVHALVHASEIHHVQLHAKPSCMDLWLFIPPAGLSLPHKAVAFPCSMPDGVERGLHQGQATFEGSGVLCGI